MTWRRYLKIALSVSVLFSTIAASGAQAPSRIATVLLPSSSPLVTFRILFDTGSAYDPPGKEGLAALTAAMLTQGGTVAMTSEQIQAVLYPTSASIGSQVDKEMTVLTGTTHRETLDRYYSVFRDMLLHPGFREDDFKRIRDNTLNFLRTSLRQRDDEELGKEYLSNIIYAGTPYAHHSRGTVSSIEKLTLEDVRQFYRANFTRTNVTLGMAGGYPAAFPETVLQDLSQLTDNPTSPKQFDSPRLPPGLRIDIVKRETDATAISLGFPISVKRGDRDWPALLVAVSYLGQHRSSNGRLFNRLREERGLNYGDYAYIEHFPQGGGSLTPPPNIGRHQQFFQIWIRPVEPQHGLFALRAALFEYDKFIREGLSRQAFEATRSFLMKYSGVLTQTQTALLGYALDSRFYRIGDYNRYLREQLPQLDVEDVNRAIRTYLKSDAMRIVMVTRDAARLRDSIVSGAASPITYNSPKPKEILDEDKVIQSFKIDVKPSDVVVRPVEELFQ